ncbi:MAG: 4'-phosphopantetheinyl transferase superfamily protein [Symploca sp. SIO2G7]|nr:4'-phosphopantetheinyl transferase superfamily protein [Symploca sp. SIO2G7]
MFLEGEWTSEVKGLGIDIAPIPRIAKLVEPYDHETLNLLFTPGEISRCQSSSHPHCFFTVSFATKEAVGKALGTGLAGVCWNEIEANLIQDKLTINLYGDASIQAKKRDIQLWLATWCYWDEHVLVHVLAL